MLGCVRTYGLFLLLILASMFLQAQDTDTLCVGGVLLFKEDFGGNDPSDPDMSTADVPGMSSWYHNSGNSLGTGNYSIRKEGWHNGIQWHWQDDHTYPNDKTRGYLLEIDGMGGGQPFYSTKIDGVLPGSLLSFSAYVVNVHYAGQLDYFGSGYVYPRLKFVINDANTGRELGAQSTGDIQPDWRYGTPDTWKYARDNQLSAEWQLVGMNFVVPEGVESIQLYIYNDVERNGNGNDFAIDDIELHMCMPPVTIEVPDTVYAGDEVTMTGEFTNLGTCVEPLEYQWYFSKDSTNWKAIEGATDINWTMIAYDGTHTGWYKLAVFSAGERGSNNYCSISIAKRMVVLIPPLCTEGKRLFFEDFGGNNPNDPVVSTTRVSGMSSAYRQATDTATGGSNGMGSGKYLVTKVGFRNSTIKDYSVWHVMDDHTYPDDKTRGYMLEIDGKGGQDVFYRTTLNGVCAGSKLTFSAYVANLTTATQYNVWRYDRYYVFPQLTFVIADAQTGREITHFSTDTISHDWSLFKISGAWRYSAQWQQIGMNFVVPEGVESIQLYIRNYGESNDTGNDFALDDIEVRLCAPPVTILAPDTVCIDTKNIFHAVFENDSTFAEPLQYKWFFSADSLTWEPVANGNSQDLKLKAKPRHTGWYKVAVSGNGNIDYHNCRVESEPHWFYVIEDCPPILCPEGGLLMHEDIGSIVSTYNTPIDGLCANTDLALIAHLPQGHTTSRLLFHINDPAGMELKAYDTGDIPSDSLIAGTTFTVPEGMDGIRIIINDNYAGTGFAIEDIEIRLCLEPVIISGANPACRKKKHTMWAEYDNYGTIFNPEYKWYYSPDSAGTYEPIDGATQSFYAIPIVHKSDEGWYRAAIAETGTIENEHCRSISEPYHLLTKYCETAVDQHIDTVVCDTLMPVTWRGHVWPQIGLLTDTIKDFEDDDSLHVHLSLDTIKCCPDVRTFRLDSILCDTLMPLLWFFQDTMLLFEKPGEQVIEYAHHKWENCIGESYTLALDTVHCERLYRLIVNKYNWQLVLDNVELRRLFPDTYAVNYQWYKNEEPIPGANADDYAEQNELHGKFQLCIIMNDGLWVWTNILEIDNVEQEAPVETKVYNWRNLYIIRYRQGDKVWVEKKVKL